MRRAPVAWAALGGAVSAVPPAGGRKATAGVGHGAAHLLLLVADVRKVPDVVRCRNKGEGTGSKATQRHWRDRQPSLKKTTVSH